MKKDPAHAVLGGISTLFFLLLIRSPAWTSAAVTNGLRTASERLIPSLFPFLVLTQLLAGSGVLTRLGLIFAKPFSFLFGLPGELAGAFSAGLVGGFPGGAVMAREYVEQGLCDKKEAERFVFLADQASPAFTVGVIGSLWGSAAIGWRLWLSLTAATFTVGVFGKKKTAPFSQAKEACPTSGKSVSSLLTSAVENAAGTMLRVTAFAVFFSVIADLLIFCLSPLLGETAAVFGVCFFELSSAARLAAALPRSVGLLLTAFALGFSGLSVHLQIASVLDGSGIGFGHFFGKSIIRGLLCTGYFLISLLFLPIP